MIIQKKLGFIGAGNMAEAFITGLVDKIFLASHIQVSDIDTERLEYLKKTYAIKTTSDNQALFQNNDIIILSIKPQVMKTVLTDIQPSHQKLHRLVISIAAGIPIKTIETVLYGKLDQTSRQLLPVIRVMPNTPALVQKGMSAFCGNTYASENDIQIVSDILGEIGKVICVSESQMDDITAVSGSGPAYVFYFVESMIQAAKELGFSENHARMLVFQTTKGALQLLEQPGACPIKLRKQVTSKGGTTEAAMSIMYERQVKNSIVDAIQMAKKRAQELSNM